MVVLAGLQGDVVAEPLGLLVGVGMAAHVDQEGRVVDDRALFFAKADTLGQAKAIRHWRSTCSMGWPKPRSIPRDKAATSSASRTRPGSSLAAIVHAIEASPVRFLRGER